MITKTYNNTKFHNSNSRHTKKNIFQNKIQNNLIVSEVFDDKSYQHFKSLLPSSPGLCKGKSHSGKPYKVHIALAKDFKTLKKQQHYRLIYIHNTYSIIAYISVKIYKRDGGFIFVHKLCSTGNGAGSKLMKLILADAKKNYNKLGITYLSLTTHNLDLVDYYKQFKPTRTEIINNPGSKAKNVKKVAYMIWQLSADMPNMDFS
jgi:hypothetical protein